MKGEGEENDVRDEEGREGMGRGRMSGKGRGRRGGNEDREGGWGKI